ncbi:MAG TPA: hypothetical protein DD727_01210, partial [Clostridiales bacterium]|nr:hypothetical protein [Clostridiales bacterium]
MNYVKRAWYAVTRKPGRSLILLVLFAAIANFVFAGIAIKHATQQASILARQKLGGTLTLTYDMQKAFDTIRAQRQAGAGAAGAGGAGGVQGQAGRFQMTVQPITETGALAVGSLNHIIDQNIIVNTNANADGFIPITTEEAADETPAASGSTTAAASTRQANEDRNPLAAVLTGNRRMPDVSITGVSETILLDSFNDGTLLLLEGEHISVSRLSTGSIPEVLIESNLAEENSIKVGDIIKIVPYVSNASVTADSAEVKVSGIYESNQAMDTASAGGFGGVQGMDFRQPYNMIYTDYKTALALKDAAAAASGTAGTGGTGGGILAGMLGAGAGIDSVVYFVDDPVNIEKVQQEAQSVQEVDWNV